MNFRDADGSSSWRSRNLAILGFCNWPILDKAFGEQCSDPHATSPRSSPEIPARPAGRTLQTIRTIAPVVSWS